jgi:hypothetical protein
MLALCASHLPAGLRLSGALMAPIELVSEQKSAYRSQTRAAAQEMALRRIFHYMLLLLR